jgi:hypothetical protein
MRRQSFSFLHLQSHDIGRQRRRTISIFTFFDWLICSFVCVFLPQVKNKRFKKNDKKWTVLKDWRLSFHLARVILFLFSGWWRSVFNKTKPNETIYATSAIKFKINSNDQWIGSLFDMKRDSNLQWQSKCWDSERNIFPQTSRECDRSFGLRPVVESHTKIF